MCYNTLGKPRESEIYAEIFQCYIFASVDPNREQNVVKHKFWAVSVYNRIFKPVKEKADIAVTGCYAVVAVVKKMFFGVL